jgi:NADPH-dependent 2,4-dienoyl-CoA reductase/sulfur reductase-like enzyme
MSPRRVVVVGADAADIPAAHQALRTAERHGDDLAITVLDKGTHTSYSACGIPYWMAGDVDSGDDLEVLAAKVAAGETDPYAAADRLLDGGSD